MNDPFYRNSWGSSPFYPASFRGAAESRKPKVVSIPVHFVKPESENCCRSRSRDDCAVRIQKLWRGYRVRKNVKKILAISRELDKVDCSILERETVDAIRRDEKERLKVSEGLMSLLLMLDSVGGFDGAVRELRRSVTRRAIMLQEKVDSIIARAGENPANNSTVELPKTECEDQQPEEEFDSRPREDAEENGVTPDLQPDPETEEPYPDPEPSEVSPSTIEAKSEGRPVEKREEEAGGSPDLQPDLEICEVSPSRIEAKSEENPVEKKEEETGDLQPDLPAKLACETELSPCESEGNLAGKRGEEEESLVEEREIGVVQEVKKSGRAEEGKGSREMLEKMVEENNKLMALMADLYEKNEMQTQILSSLSQRVEQLENAFACEKHRRAKKVKKARHSQCFGRKAD